MFTGTISHLGKIKERTQNGLLIEAPNDLLSQLKKSSSIAINGVCLTVYGILSNKLFRVDIIPETFKKTALGRLNKDYLVNLELPLGIKDRFNGHIVQGHIDGVGTVAKIVKKGNSKLFTINIPNRLSKYIVEKGSIAVNGISLTVIEARKKYFTVGIIPFTWNHTMLHNSKVGDLLNIEVDHISKYLEKLLKKEGRL